MRPTQGGFVLWSEGARARQATGGANRPVEEDVGAVVRVESRGNRRAPGARSRSLILRLRGSAPYTCVGARRVLLFRSRHKPEGPKGLEPRQLCECLLRLVDDSCIVVMSRCLVVMTRCLVVMTRCLVVMTRCLVVRHEPWWPLVASAMHLKHWQLTQPATSTYPRIPGPAVATMAFEDATTHHDSARRARKAPHTAHTARVRPTAHSTAGARTTNCRKASVSSHSPASTNPTLRWYRSATRRPRGTS